MVILLVRSLIRKKQLLPNRLYVIPNRRLTDCNPPKKRKSSFIQNTLTNIGAVGTIVFGTILLARNNDSFRDTVRTTFPYGEEIIHFICSDMESVEDGEDAFALMPIINHIKDSMSSSVNKYIYGKRNESEKETDTSEVKNSFDLTEADKPYEPPKSVFESIVEGYQELQQTESSVEVNDKKHTNHAEDIIAPVEELDGCEVDPSKISALENRLGSLVKQAIESYRKSLKSLHTYVEAVEKIVDETSDFFDDNLWVSLDTETHRKNEDIRRSDELTNAACQIRSQLLTIFADPRIKIDEDYKTQVKRNMSQMFEDLDMARKQYDIAKQRSNVTQKYWERVKDARDYFSEELQMLFPDVDFDKPILNFSDSDGLDLLLIFLKMQYMILHRRCDRLETVADAKIDEILSADDMEKQKKEIDFFANKKFEEFKANLEIQYQRKLLETKRNSSRELRRQLQLQTKANMDHLADALEEQRGDLEEKFNEDLNIAVQKQTHLYHLRLAELIGRLVTIEVFLKKRTVSDKHAKQSQLLWSACENLYSTIGMSNTMYGEKTRMHLINQEVEMVRTTAGETDDFVFTILNSIPQSVLVNGLYTEEGLRDRFVKVEAMVKKLALVPENGGSLITYFMSYLQSYIHRFRVRRISEQELMNEEINFNDLDTYAIIARARYWMDRGDFPLVLRYMNLLSGASRQISQDWVVELRKFVEMKVITKALMAHAVGNGLVNLELLS